MCLELVCTVASCGVGLGFLQEFWVNLPPEHLLYIVHYTVKLAICVQTFFCVGYYSMINSKIICNVITLYAQLSFM